MVAHVRGWHASHGSAFHSGVRDLIQIVMRPDTTTQTQNVGDGDFAGLDYYELAWGYPQPGRTFYVRTRMRF